MTRMVLAGGLVVDGTGVPGQVADVMIEGGVVTAVEPGRETHSGAQVVDASDHKVLHAVCRLGASVHGAQGQERRPLRCSYPGQAGDVPALKAAIPPPRALPGAAPPLPPPDPPILPAPGHPP